MPLSEIFLAVRWWIVFLLITTAVFPLSFHLFHRLPDRGFAFTKPLGLLIISYLFWILGSLGIVGNNLGGVLVGIGSVIGLSIWAGRKEGAAAMGRWLRDHWRHLLLTEIVFAALFFLWVWARAQNPAIAATEKPMEFAFLNSLTRSPQFPPNDPWLSGFGISYYYFGYVMSSVMGRLTAVGTTAVSITPITFNLTLAWLVAGTGTAAFGLVYNLLANYGRKTAVLLGLIAALAIPLAGNMEMGLELAHANGIGNDAFWTWLDMRDLPAPAIEASADAPARYESGAWWWWRSSRPIHEYHLSGRVEEGLEPIVEFPAFSFVLGDMHPHVLALPFTFLSMAMALLWFLDDKKSNIRVRWLFTALILGGLAFLNTWDVLIHLFVMVGAFTLGRWRDDGKINLSQSVLFALSLVGGLFVLYYPFFLGFSSQAAAPYLLPMLMRPTRLPHFLTIFGMSLIPITILMAVLVVRQRFTGWKAGLKTAVFLPLSLFIIMLFFGWMISISSAGAGTVTGLATELGLNLSPHPGGIAIGWGTTAVFTLLPTLLTARVVTPFVTLLLIGLIGTAVMIWANRNNQQSTENNQLKMDPLPFVLLLIVTAALLTLGTEFLYLRDNFGVRMNTIFKFYYQAWSLFGVAGLFGLGWLWHHSRKAGIVAIVGYGAAFAMAMAFPVYAVNSRAIEYRGAVDAETRQPATLDGLAQRARYNPAEYEAIIWMRDNVEGDPVILEATGGAYSDYGRFSTNTGLPTLLGWANHEYQWRGGSTNEPALRADIIRNIYTSPDWGYTTQLLGEYNVEYIIVGNTEMTDYGEIAHDKFNGRLEEAFRNEEVVIYRWANE